MKDTKENKLWQELLGSSVVTSSTLHTVKSKPFSSEDIFKKFKDFEDLMKKREDEQNHICPYCGRCPHCGRRYNEPWPLHPYQPWDWGPPYPYVTWTDSDTGNYKYSGQITFI